MWHRLNYASAPHIDTSYRDDDAMRVGILVVNSNNIFKWPNCRICLLWYYTNPFYDLFCLHICIWGMFFKGKYWALIRSGRSDKDNRPCRKRPYLDDGTLETLQHTLSLITLPRTMTDRKTTCHCQTHIMQAIFP